MTMMRLACCGIVACRVCCCSEPPRILNAQPLLCPTTTRRNPPHHTPHNAHTRPPDRKRTTNPATLATSGYVFCYPCAFAHVLAHGRCPVSGLGAGLDHVRKLYEAA